MSTAPHADTTTWMLTAKRSCADCGSEISGPRRRYCDRCVSARCRTRTTRYQPNEFIDAQLRRAYERRPEHRATAIPGLADLAGATGWSRDALQKRARALGLTRTKDRPWSNDEERIVLEFAWMSEERIQRKLRAAGFRRTLAAIALKVKRLHAKAETDTYTAAGLGHCFGVGAQTISRWIKLGLLRAKWRDGSPTKAIHAHWVIHEKDVRDFVLRHPMEFNIRFVDQLWFLSLITNGKICQ